MNTYPNQPYGYYAPAPAPKKINHVLHLILTIATSGIWGIVWLILILRRVN